jgi:serine/threonine-protein kinase HipA
MAAAAGIEMSPCRLLHENGRAHFMTKRFDRTQNKRHHMQTLCAISHLDYKQVGTHSYHQLFQAAQSLGLGDHAMEQTLLRMVFNVLAVNNDDHTKNFSFLLREGGRWELAPAYDITHAFKLDSKWVKEHQMSVNGKFDKITRADVRAVSDRFDLLAAVPDAIDKARAAVARWRVFAASSDIDADEAKVIADQMLARDQTFFA